MNLEFSGTESKQFFSLSSQVSIKAEHEYINKAARNNYIFGYRIEYLYGQNSEENNEEMS